MTKFCNRIINGESLEILKKIPSKTFDLVFADPPYNMQIGEKLMRPDNSKVHGVNDKWDQFLNFEHYDEFSKEFPLMSLFKNFDIYEFNPKLNPASTSFVVKNQSVVLVFIF